MTVDLTSPEFHDEDKAREWLEASRWPNGPYCPHCGSVKATRMQGEKHRTGCFQCNDCRGQFTVLTGSVMESSHLPLAKWVFAIRLMTASKKGMSAHQMHRMLSVTYKTAWFMCHRIREAMREVNPAPLGGEGKVVEADEAYKGRKAIPVPSPRRKGRPYIHHGKAASKCPIFALVSVAARPAPSPCRPSPVRMSATRWCAMPIARAGFIPMRANCIRPLAPNLPSTRLSITAPRNTPAAT